MAEKILSSFQGDRMNFFTPMPKILWFRMLIFFNLIMRNIPYSKRRRLKLLRWNRVKPFLFRGGYGTLQNPSVPASPLFLIRSTRETFMNGPGMFGILKKGETS